MPLNPNRRYLHRAKRRRYESSRQSSDDRYSDKSPDETIRLTRDFSRLLEPGVVLTGAGWDVSVIDGTDANPTAMKTGTATIDGHRIGHLIRSGIAGADYRQIAIVETENGQREEQWGSLRVVTPQGKALPDKTIGEKLALGVDFASLMPDGVTISTAAWEAKVESGTDPSPENTLSGSAEIFDITNILQLVIAGQENVRYRHIAKATLSDGQILHEHLLITVIADKTTILVGM